MTTVKLYNLARVNTATLGTGTLTLGSAITGYLSFADAGVQDGDEVSYGIKDGSNTEVGRGTYGASGATLTRGALKSTNSDSEINITSGVAEVYITPLGEDFGERVVGPASSTDGNIALFDGVTGEVLKDGGKGVPTGAIVGTTDTQTLTNKTLSLDDNTVKFTAAGTGAVARSVSDALGEVINVMNFGAKGDNSTDDTSAINAAIAYGNTLSRKALYFPRVPSRYKISSALTALAGSQWTVFGDGRDFTWISQTADAPIFTLDATAADTNFTTIRGLYLLGANAGSDTGSMGIKADGSTSSLTGVNFLRVQDCYFQNLKYGIYLDPTQIDSLGLSAHSRWEIIGNTFLPGFMDSSIYSPGASMADGSLIGSNWIRGTVAGIKFGDGTDSAIGDLNIFGNQISAPIGIDLNGPTTAGHYNQNVNIVGNQLDGAISSATLKARNMKNFRYAWNNSTASYGPDIDGTCSNYWVEDRNELGYSGGKGLKALAGLTAAANKIPMFSGASTATLLDLFSFATKLSFGAIADDGVSSLRPTSSSIFGAFLVICSTSSATTKPAILWIRGASSPEVRLIAESATATGQSFTLTTGALTGTTGTDGKVTVSADSSGNIYVENRAGGGIAVSAFLLQIA